MNMSKLIQRKKQLEAFFTIMGVRFEQPDVASFWLPDLDILVQTRSQKPDKSDLVKARVLVKERDPLAVWLDQHTVDQPDGMVPKVALRAAYERACRDIGRPILDETQFTLALKRLRPTVQARQRTVNGKQHTWVFTGLEMQTAGFV